MDHMKMIAEGAEAKIYEVDVFGKEVLVKRREPKGYRIKEIDIDLRRTRTKKEAKIIARAFEYGISVPSLIGVSDFSIYMSKINGKLLKDRAITKQDASSAGILLGQLHNSGMVHGDFTPANIISDGRKLYLIDFGLSDIIQSDEERALDVLLMKRQLEKQLYSEFEKGYSSVAQSAAKTLSRLASIERRGRYQSRTLV